MQHTFKLDELASAVALFASHISNATVVVFHGQMGAGKTTFISALCQFLGTGDAVGSPTYSIINQYKTATGQLIYHMDWYRLNDEEDAIQAGVEDALYSGNLCFVEWPERAAGLLPDNTLHVTISLIDHSTRLIEFAEI
jgi:tRNA threonylcarbamoyladenosine biosynthesis protein TsaE